VIKLRKWVYVAIVFFGVIVLWFFFREEIGELWFVRVDIVDEELPRTINSGQLINLNADSWAWPSGPPRFEWDDVNCNGTFCPDPSRRRPSWFYINNSGSETTCILRVEASAWGFTHSDEYRINVRPTPQPSISIPVTPPQLRLALGSSYTFPITLNMPAENLSVTANNNRVRVQNLQLPGNCASGQNIGSFDVQNVTGGGKSIITVAALDFPPVEVTVTALPVLEFRAVPPTFMDPSEVIPENQGPHLDFSGNFTRFYIAGPQDLEVTLTRSNDNILMQQETSPSIKIVTLGVTNQNYDFYYFELGIQGQNANQDNGSYSIEATATGFDPVTIRGVVCPMLTRGQCN
jgi:hypothetical protein